MKRSYFRPNVDKMAPYAPGEQPGPGEKVIKLNTNENPYPPSSMVLEAVRRSAEESLRLYPDPESRRLREAASGAYGFPADWIMAGNGSDELLCMLVRAFVPEGGLVAYPVPTYSLYRTLVQAQGAKARELRWGRDWSLPKGLARRGTRLVFLARPNSPSGTCVPKEEVRALARSLDGVLCIDEAYAEFSDDDCLDLVRESENVIVLRTLSKSFSLAGARVGFAFARPRVLEGLRKVKDSYNLSRMAQAAGAAALQDLAWMRENVERVRRTRARLTERLRRLGLAVPDSQSNFVFARAGERAKELCAELRSRGILVRYFDEPGARDSIRISVGTDAEVDALLAALGELLGCACGSEAGSGGRPAR